MDLWNRLEEVSRPWPSYKCFIIVDREGCQYPLLVDDGIQSDVIIRDPAMEELGGVMYIGNSLGSFTMGDKAVQVPMEPDHPHGDVGKNDRTDSEDFTVAQSGQKHTDKDTERLDSRPWYLGRSGGWAKSMTHRCGYGDGE